MLLPTATYLNFVTAAIKASSQPGLQKSSSSSDLSKHSYPAYNTKTPHLQLTLTYTHKTIEPLRTMQLKTATSIVLVATLMSFQAQAAPVAQQDINALTAVTPPTQPLIAPFPDTKHFKK